MFAAIAEISGTTILPFIEPENQSVYVWFLMLFPVLLVGAFFWTLNFNHKVLYAPSDYKDERNFIDPYGKASPEEQDKKLRDEVQELEAETPEENQNQDDNFDGKNTASTKDENTFTRINAFRYRRLMADVTLAEKLAVNRLSKELALNFKTDVRIDLPDLRRAVVYDALGINDKEVHAVEVKLFKAKRVDPHRFADALEQSEAASRRFEKFDSRDFTLHIFAVMDTSDVEIAILENTLGSFANRYKVKVKIHVTTLNDLQNEYQHSI